MVPSSKGRARNWREAGRGAAVSVGSVNPMGTAMAGAPVGGDICGELFPAATCQALVALYTPVEK